MNNLPAGGKIILAKDSDSTVLESVESRKGIEYMSLAQLKNVAATNWDLLSNGVTDVVVVCFDSPAVHTDNIEEVTSSYSADDLFMNSILHSLGSDYLAIFTVEKPAAESIKQARAIMMARQLSDDSGAFYPSDVIEAHIVMIPFLIILFTGICCTCSVQSELKFDAEKKTFKK